MHDKTVSRGDLYFLWHPGTNFVFSGYGLTTKAGQKDLLVGLVMVDRPQPVSRAWLARVKQNFGGYELYPMTASQERGIVCQMRIEPKSLELVSTLDDPLSERLRVALTPLLLQPPQPRLFLHWDLAGNVWQSQLDLEESNISNSQTNGSGPTALPDWQPLFSPGQVVATPGALDALNAADANPFEFVVRHIQGDWGDLLDEERQANEQAVHRGLRILSRYPLPTGVKLWVITEHDRSVTTLLLASEY